MASSVGVALLVANRKQLLPKNTSDLYWHCILKIHSKATLALFLLQKAK